jgi:hypothetical protein
VRTVTYAMPGRRTLTVGQLRELLEILPPETPLLVVIRDRHHFQHPARRSGRDRRGDHAVRSDRALTFDVEKLT